MAWLETPISLSLVIIFWKSAVVPGSLLPRSVARSLILAKSAVTWPLESIMAVLRLVAASSASAKAAMGPPMAPIMLCPRADVACPRAVSLAPMAVSLLCTPPSWPER